MYAFKLLSTIEVEVVETGGLKGLRVSNENEWRGSEGYILRVMVCVCVHIVVDDQWFTIIAMESDGLSVIHGNMESYNWI